MKKLILISGLLICMNGLSKEIIESNIHRHINILASDEFEGRATPSKGQELAIKFLENHYASNNISPLQEDTYFQTILPPKRFEKWWSNSDIKPKNAEQNIRAFFPSEKREENYRKMNRKSENYIQIGK